MDYNAYYLEMLKKFVAIPSTSQHEEAFARELERILREELSMETRLYHVEGEGYNVMGTWKGTKPGRTILLGGHIDTVTPSAAWSTDPFVLHIDGDKGYGLGSADMKGGLAAQLVALKQWKDEGVDFAGTIIFSGMCDEERHSLGANAYVEQVQQGLEEVPDFAIFAEPHYDNMVIGATGKVLLKLTVFGEQGHAANPETGVNAITCLSRLLSAMDQKYTPLYEAGERASFCPLRIESRYEGYSLNIPEECSTWINKQLFVGEEIDQFIEEVKALYEEKVGVGRLEIQREIPYYPSYLLDQENQDYKEVMQILTEEFNIDPELRINQSVTDGNITYHTLGIPTILLGPLGKDYHKANEYIDLPSAYHSIVIIRRVLENFFRIEK